MRIPRKFASGALVLSAGVVGACERQPAAPAAAPPAGPLVSEVVITRAEGTARPPFEFSPDDERFLEEVQRGAFNFLWSAGEATATGMVPDRTSKPTVSVAGVGFQLAGICIGVERGWVTREQGEARALKIVRALSENPANRKAGLFYHFIDAETAGQPAEAYERVVSTIDSALLLSGVLTASRYFGGEVQRLGDSIFEEADWTFFVSRRGVGEPISVGFVTLGWKPTRIDDPTGEGALLPYAWIDSGDEHRLVTFLAVCAPSEQRRVDPAVYYRMRRQLGEYGDTGPFVWFPWSGALFTAFFAHCFIDYAAMGPDAPLDLGVERRPRVDWWENSRRTARMHKLKAIENPMKLAGLGENAWGLTASDVEDGYAVPGLFPNPVEMIGAIPQLDYPTAAATDKYGDGTLAPYGAGCCIMFDPAGAVAALRHYRSLKRQDGEPLVWQDPAKGGYGFQDAFNLGTGWVAPDCLAIDQGPLLLAIENARSGLVWRLFHEHPFIAGGMERLKLKRPGDGVR